MTTQAQKTQAAAALAEITALRDIMRNSMRHVAGGYGHNVYGTVFMKNDGSGNHHSIADVLQRFDALVATVPVLEAIVADAATT